MHDADIEDDDDIDGILLPYDERDHKETTFTAQGGQGVQAVNKKNKIPFSFLMHHYMKNNNNNNDTNNLKQ